MIIGFWLIYSICCLIVNAKKVLVTGGAGFIGFHTALKLAEDSDNEVVVLDVFDDSYSVDLKRARAGVLKEKGVVVHSGDVCSKQMLDYLFKEFDFNFVIHLAGKEGASASIKDLIGYTTANSKCLLKLLETLTEHEETHLVYASSYSVYGNQGNDPVSVHDSLGPPISIYAALKIGAEEMVRSYCLKYQLTAVGLRLFNVYGPWGRPDGDIYRITSLVDKNKKVEIYKEDSIIASRDYTYIDDAVNGIIAAMNYKPTTCNAIFNIGSGRKPVTMETVHRLIIDGLMKTSNELVHDPLPLYEPLVTNANISYTRKELGYSPITSIEEGIRLFIEWYKLYHKDKKWKSPDPDTKLQNKLHNERIDYVNQKYLDRLAKLRLKFQHYAEANKLPFTTQFRPKTYLEIKGKKPSCLPLRTHKKGELSLKERRQRCLDIEECVAYDTNGGMYSHVGQQKDWTSFDGTTYLADIDICKAGITSCYGNCTCKYTGPSQAEYGCEEGYGLIKNVDDRYFCQELYSPNKSTFKEQEFKLADDIENRDFNALAPKGLGYVLIKDTSFVGGTVAFYPEAAGDVERLKKACDKTYHCVGFSTDGDLKGMLTERSWEHSKGIDMYTKDFDYCTSLDYKVCQCKILKPGKYQCPRKH